MNDRDFMLEQEMAAAEKRAWDALGRYKFWMFGYWAAVWIHLNRYRRPQNLPNPFRDLVKAARQHHDAEFRARLAATAPDAFEAPEWESHDEAESLDIEKLLDDYYVAFQQLAKAPPTDFDARKHLCATRQRIVDAFAAAADR